MANTKTESVRFKFEAAPIVMAFPAVITPKAPQYGNGKVGDPCYQVNAVIKLDHPELQALKTAMNQVARHAFGADMTDEQWRATLKIGRDELGHISFPLKDGTKLADKAKAKKKDYEFYRDTVVLVARSKQYAPALFYVANGDVVEIEPEMRTQAGAKFYHGVEGSIGVTLVAYKGNGAESLRDRIDDCVVAYLADAVSLCRGKKLGGGGAERYSNFAKNMGTVSADDPTDDGEDAGISL